MQHESVANCSDVKKIQTVYTEVMEITKVFGENLREFREGLNLSADDFGVKIGITGKHVYDIEKGRKKPSMDVVEAIEGKFKVEAADLFKRKVVPVKHLPMSQSLKMALNVPDEVYSLANELELDHEVWEDIIETLEIAVEDRRLNKKG